MPSSMSDSSVQQSSSFLENSSAGLPQCGWQWVENIIGTNKLPPISYALDDPAGTFGSMPDADEIVMEVKLLHCVSPSEIIVRARPDEKKFDLLEENMQLAYANFTKRRKRAFDVGFHCAAKVNNFWIRAVVTDIEGSDCTIMSYDDGEEYVIPIEGVYPLIPPFDAIQMFQFKISLINVNPLHSVWLPHVSLRITELLTTAKNILVCYRGKSQSNLRTIEAMVVYEYSQAHGPLQIGGRILANLNEQLVEENLATNQEITTVVRKPSITAWPKALPITFADGFLGQVTFLTMDGSVYLYDVNKSANILNEMCTFFTQEYENSQPSSEDLACRKGDLCVSKYLDGKWYRGTVVAIEERPGTVTVCFVDYGTVDYIDRHDVRKQVNFENVPVQVIKGCIDNVRPARTRKGEPLMWPTKTLNKIHSIIVDKQCWTRVHSQSPLMISLQLPDGEDLSRHLVESGLAEYIAAPRRSLW